MITYKEMCALATDLNQPDLVYKFLAVANQQSEWATRRGGALGVAALSRKVGVSLEPHMAKLVPRLFRYQFDPHPKIQQVSAQSVLRQEDIFRTHGDNFACDPTTQKF